MPKKLDIWACSVCKAQFDSKLDAESCEKTHEQTKQDSIVAKLRDKQLPPRHKDDDIYLRHCVLCGELVKEWEYRLDDEYEGRHSPGRVLHEDKGAEKLAGGWYCSQCKHKFPSLLEKADRKVLEYIIRSMK